MSALIMCMCGHNAAVHAIDDPSWKTALCLTQFHVEPSGCRCDEYRPADGEVLVYWDGNTGRTGGWHACTQADWFDLRVEPITNRFAPAKRVTLGRRFIDDHESRDLPYGVKVDENKLTYTLLMTVDDIREVYSDACHYADSMGEWLEDDDTGYARSVIQAAGRVVEGLRKQVPDQLK